MPASWELGNDKPKLLIGLPHKDMVNISWALAFRNLQVNVPSIFTMSRGTPIDMARNEIVKSALDNNVEYIFFLDSVPSYTPLIVRNKYTHEIDIKPISELGNFIESNDVQRIDTNEELEILDKSEDGSWTKWTRITKIIRHPFKDNLREIVTPYGMIHISKNHSLYGINGDKSGLIDAELVKIGQRLTMPKMPNKSENGTYFLGKEDLAWLYGFFAAEGSTNNNHNIRICNTQIDLIEKSKNILENYFNRAVYIKEYTDNDKYHTHYCEITNKNLTTYFNTLFYTDDKQKRVPKIILNAPTRIKKAFLDGYNIGDGSRNHITNAEYLSFTTKSQTLALGLQYLLLCVGQDSWNITTTRKVNSNTYLRLDINKGIHNKVNRLIVKSIDEIPYEGYLYDISTESHRFCGGVGNFLLHNTDVECPPDTIARLMSTQLPIVSGVYWTRAPPLEPCVWNAVEPNGKKAVSFTPGQGLIKCNFIGMGCCLIHTSVFRNLKKPYFNWTLSFEDPENNMMGRSEDFHFCREAEKRGYSIYVDTNIICKHSISNAFSENGQIQISQI